MNAKSNSITTNIFDIGPEVNLWMLKQVTADGITITEGAYPATSNNAITPIAQAVADAGGIVVGDRNNAMKFEAAYQRCLANGEIARYSGTPAAPVAYYHGRMHIGEATQADFFYCYKLAVAGRNFGGDVLPSAFNGTSDVISHAANMAIINDQPDASAFDEKAYTGELVGI